MLDTLAAAVWVLDPIRNRWMYANPSCERLTGHRPAADDAERPLAHWFDWIHAEDRDAYVADLTAWIAGSDDAPHVRAVRMEGPHGERWLSCSTTRHRDETGATVLLCAVAVDVTELRARQVELARAATVDPLTELRNRRGFEESLDRALAGCATGDSAAVIMIDLDGFKQINDTFGHDAGDRLLVAVAERIQQVLRPGDEAARVGGDEFAVILHRIAPGEARAVARRVLHAVNGAQSADGDAFVGSAGSVGLAVLAPGERLTRSEALRRADAAVYGAKAHRRGDVTEYRSGSADASALAQRSSVARRVVAGLTRDRITLHAQPIRDLRSSRTVAHELLLRLDDGGDPLNASTIVTEARRAGLLPLLDQWVLRRAFEVAAAHAAVLDGRPLHANVSGSTLCDRSLAPRLHGEFLRLGLSPGAVHLEVTDGDVPDVATARDVAADLRRLGIDLVLEGFGAAEGSALLLRSLPFAGIKLAPPFAHAHDANAIDDSFVTYAVDLGRTVAITVHATGVEDPDDRMRLRALGVERAQGRLLGAPEPLATAFDR